MNNKEKLKIKEPSDNWNELDKKIEINTKIKDSIQPSDIDKDEDIVITRIKKSKVPPYFILGNGMKSKYHNEDNVIDALEIFKQMGKPEMDLFIYFRNAIIEQQIESKFGVYTYDANVVHIPVSKNHGLSQALKKALSKFYTHLEELKVLKRIRRGKYMINPYLLIPNSNFEKVALMWQKINTEIDEDENEGIDFGSLSSTIFTKSEQVTKKALSFDVSSIEVLPEYTKIIKYIMKGNTRIFVTGKAGTGKSTMIRYMRSQFQNTIVVAPTAIAATNVEGSTLHSFFSIPIKITNPEDIPKTKEHIMPVLTSLELLIIDEISMVNAAQIDMINNILQHVRKNKLPFGGISVLFVGDLFQLPPIVDDPEVNKFFNHKYDSKFFFSADIFKKANIVPIELIKVRRQEGDDNFIEILNSLRIEDKNYTNKLDELNSACFSENRIDEPNDTISLVPTKAIAKSINDDRLSNIDSPSKEFKAELIGLKLEDVKNFQAPDILELKVGARVVFLKNNEPSWINGSLGEVIEMDDNEHLKVKVLAFGVIVDVQRETWSKLSYEYDSTTKRIETVPIGEYKQFPLTLGWAITIHKSQGLTLDNVIVDMGNGAFTDGQTYVALSRCKSMNGLILSKKITHIAI